MSTLPKKTDFISRFEFSFLCFLAFSVPFSNHALRNFKEEISNNLRQSDSYINTSDGLFPLPNTPHGKL